MHPLYPSFLSTNYTVYPPYNQSFIIKFNTPNHDLHQFLKHHSATSYTFITAWNPQSQPLSDTENEKRNQQLANDLTAYTIFPAAGVPATGENWQAETSFFVLNIARENAMALGRKYGQLAIVFGEVEQEPELVFLTYN